MLRPAQFYKEELQRKNYETWYDQRYMYYHSSTGAYAIEVREDNAEYHQFVSVNSAGEVIGYISYRIDWCAMSADRFGIISYDIGNIAFAKDVYTAVCDLFEKYHMNRISWFAFLDNPAVRGYRRFIEKHGGVECSRQRQVARLTDGKLHDSVEFEIMAWEFHK